MSVKSALALEGVAQALVALVSEQQDDLLTMRSFTAMLLLRGGPLPISRLGQQLNIQKTTVWRVVNSLQTKGLVDRVGVPETTDRRIRSQVVLAAEGQRFLANFAARLQ